MLCCFKNCKHKSVIDDLIQVVDKGNSLTVSRKFCCIEIIFYMFSWHRWLCKYDCKYYWFLNRVYNPSQKLFFAISRIAVKKRWAYCSKMKIRLVCIWWLDNIQYPLQKHIHLLLISATTIRIFWNTWKGVVLLRVKNRSVFVHFVSLKL